MSPQPLSGSHVSLDDGDTCLHKCKVLRLRLAAHLPLHQLQVVSVLLLNRQSLLLVLLSEPGDLLGQLLGLSDPDGSVSLASSLLGGDLLILEQLRLHLLRLLVGGLLLRHIVSSLVSCLKVAVDVANEVSCAIVSIELVTHEVDHLFVLGTQLV